MKQLHKLLNKLYELGYLAEDSETKKQIVVDILLSKNRPVEVSEIIDVFEGNQKPKQQPAFYEQYLKQKLTVVFYVGGEITSLGVQMLRDGLEKAGKLDLLNDPVTNEDTAKLIYNTALTQQDDKELFKINVTINSLWRDRDLEIELNQITRYIESEVHKMPLVDVLCVSADEPYRLHQSKSHLAKQNIDYATYIKNISAKQYQDYDDVTLFVIGHGTEAGKISCQNFGLYTPLEVINALKIEAAKVTLYVPLQCHPNAAQILATQQKLPSQSMERNDKVTAQDLQNWIEDNLGNLWCR